MSEPGAVRPGTLSRILKSDADLRENFSVSKQSIEFLNQAASVFVRTLTKSCVVSAARNGKKGRLEISDLEQVINTYPQLAFLAESLPN